MNDKRAKSKISGVGWGLGGLLVIYFGFPALWIWPIWKVYGEEVPDWLETFLVPVYLMGFRFAWYADWGNWGFELLGID